MHVRSVDFITKMKELFSFLTHYRDSPTRLDWPSVSCIFDIVVVMIQVIWLPMRTFLLFPRISLFRLVIYVSPLLLFFLCKFFFTRKFPDLDCMGKLLFQGKMPLCSLGQVIWLDRDRLISKWCGMCFKIFNTKRNIIINSRGVTTGRDMCFACLPLISE